MPIVAVPAPLGRKITLLLPVVRDPTMSIPLPAAMSTRPEELTAPEAPIVNEPVPFVLIFMPSVPTVLLIKIEPFEAVVDNVSKPLENNFVPVDRSPLEETVSEAKLTNTSFSTVGLTLLFETIALPAVPRVRSVVDVVMLPIAPEVDFKDTDVDPVTTPPD